MRWSIRHCVRLFLFSNISHYRLLKIFSPGFKSHQSRLTAAEEQTTNSLLTLKCQLLTCCCRCTQAAFPSLPRCANHLTSHRRENTHTQTLDGTLTQVTYLPTHWAYISRWYTEGQTDRQWKIERWFWQTDRETILYLSIRMKFFKRREGIWIHKTNLYNRETVLQIKCEFIWRDCWYLQRAAFWVYATYVTYN